MKLSSLFRKTLLAQTLLFGLVVGSLSVASAYSLRWYLGAEYASRGSAIARGIVGYSNSVLPERSPQLLQTLLEEFSELQGVSYIFVTDSAGNLVAHTFPDGVPADFQDDNFDPNAGRTAGDRLQNPRRFTHSPNFEDGAGQAMIVYRQVETVGYVIDISLPLDGAGYVHVGMDQVRVINQIRSAAALHLWITVGLFLLSVVGTYILVQRISQPLNQLTDYAQRLANRDFSSPPVAIKGQDEIGLLASTMQSMANDIQRFIQRLETTLTELRSTQTKLIQNEKMSSLGQLVAGVAHEINNPVSFIACNITYAERYAHQLMDLIHQLDEAAAEKAALAEDIDLEFLMTDFPKVLDSMRLGTDRIYAIVRSLRNFSRLDESDCKAVDIHEGLDSTLMILASRLKFGASGDAIIVEKDYGSLPQVECYAGQLNQVFMNILSNAIDALQSSGSTTPPKITLKTCQEGALARIEIHDNGVGIPPEVQSRLFDPFFTTKPIGKGTGLGLSISYQIVVEHHGGQLHCHSYPGLGTTFLVEIPLKQQKKEARSQATVRSLPQAMG